MKPTKQLIELIRTTPQDSNGNEIILHLQQNQQLETIRYTHAELTQALNYALRHGKLLIAKALTTHDLGISQIQPNQDTMHCALLSGNIDCVLYALNYAEQQHLTLTYNNTTKLCIDYFAKSITGKVIPRIAINDPFLYLISLTDTVYHDNLHKIRKIMQSLSLNHNNTCSDYTQLHTFYNTASSTNSTFKLQTLENLRQKNAGDDKEIWIQTATNHIVPDQEHSLIDQPKRMLVRADGTQIPVEKTLLSLLADKLHAQKHGNFFCLQSEYRWVDENGDPVGERRVCNISITPNGEISGVYCNVFTETDGDWQQALYLSRDTITQKHKDKYYDQCLPFINIHFYYSLDSTLLCSNHQYEKSCSSIAHSFKPCATDKFLLRNTCFSTYSNVEGVFVTPSDLTIFFQAELAKPPQTAPQPVKPSIPSNFGISSIFYLQPKRQPIPPPELTYPPNLYTHSTAKQNAPTNTNTFTLFQNPPTSDAVDAAQPTQSSQTTTPELMLLDEDWLDLWDSHSPDDAAIQPSRKRPKTESSSLSKTDAPHSKKPTS